MKKIQTNSNKRATIGTGDRTVGLTSKPKVRKSRSTISLSRTAAKKTTSTGARKGCSSCSRSARKNK